MNRARQGFRVLALAAAVLLLWCHGLDSSFHVDAATGSPHEVVTGDATLATAVPAHPAHSEVSCCFGGAGSNLLTVALAKLPAVAAPLLAALLSVPLLLAAQRTLRPSPQRLAPHRTSLVDQSVLIRI
jgi:hypothetical protein